MGDRALTPCGDPLRIVWGTRNEERPGMVLRYAIGIIIGGGIGFAIGRFARGGG